MDSMNSGQHPPPYNQPPQQPKRRNPWQWYKSKGRSAKLGIGCGTLLVALVLCVCSLAAYGSTLQAQKAVQPTPTTNNNIGGIATTATTPTPLLTRLTATATMAPTSTPTAEPTPTAKPTQKPTPKPQPTQPPKPKCQAVNNNPWCYNFNPGNLIYTPPNGFCNYFNCIASFYEADDPDGGHIVECSDGTYSQSGGERGACSYHGGVYRALYSH